MDKRLFKGWPIWLAIAAITGLYVFLVWRGSWVSDDSFITVRTADNFLHGYGLRWNTGERVQTYTNPLWLLWIILAALVSHLNLVDILFASGWLMSAAVILIIIWKYRDRRLPLLLGLSILALSKAYIDYSTSGLENPLSHLLALLFVLTAFYAKGERRAPLLFLFAGLGSVNRLDMAALYLPYLIYEVWRMGWRKSWRPALVGLSPLIVWLVFSVIYYGFPLPNTAYAKLGAGVPQFVFLQMGWRYVLNSFHWDPLTLSTVVLAAVAAFTLGKWRHRWLMVGVFLYAFLVVRDGGDFMSGRFFTTGLLISILILMEVIPEKLGWKPFAIVWGGVLLVGMVGAVRSPLLNPITLKDTPIWDIYHIADEGRFYCPFTCWSNHEKIPEFDWAKQGIQAAKTGTNPQVTGFVGMWGYFAGPQITLVDYNALGDPLMARLPMAPNVPWGHGHYPRTIPDGYVATAWTGMNLITNPCIKGGYSRLHTVITGPLFSTERWKQILYLNSPWGMKALRGCLPDPGVDRPYQW